MKFFKEVLLVFAIVLLSFGSTALFASAAGVSFGGFATAFVPTIFVPPTPLTPLIYCPSHQVVTDFGSGNVFGITTELGGQLYANYNYFVAGVFLLGAYVPVPVTTCPQYIIPYPIYPNFMEGSS